MYHTLYTLKLGSKKCSICVSVLNIYVCVKFGCKSASGYGHLGKTTQGVIFGTPCTSSYIKVNVRGRVIIHCQVKYTVKCKCTVFGFWLVEQFIYCVLSQFSVSELAICVINIDNDLFLCHPVVTSTVCIT